MIIISIIISLILLITLLEIYVIRKIDRELDRHIKGSDENPADFGLRSKTHIFYSRDKTQLIGWYFQSKEPKAIIILVHGFSPIRGGKAYMLSRAKFLIEQNFDVFMFDLGAFGESKGNKITLGINESSDLNSAYEHVQKFNEHKLPLGIWGNSMGAATTLIMQGQTQKADFLITTVPYESITSLINPLIKREYKSIWILYYFIKFAFYRKFGNHMFSKSPLKLSEQIKVPIFIAKASNDSLVNPDDSDKIYNQIKSEKRLLEYESTHDIWKDQGDKLKRDILKFLNSVVSMN